MANSKWQPDFIGIGFAKCGTTWIADSLKEHPQICLPEVKETEFFLRKDLDGSPKEIVQEYKNYFYNCQESSLKGEFCNPYGVNPRALENIKTFFPKVKIIISLREPVKRAISLFIHNFKFSSQLSRKEINEKLKEEVEKGQIRCNYYHYLKPWFDSFPRENIFVVVFEEMLENPTKQLQELYSFLGVDDSFVPSSLQNRTNPAHTYRFPLLQKFLAREYARIKRHPSLLKTLEKIFLLNRIKGALNRINKKPYQKPQIKEETIEYLKKYCYKDIKKIEKLIGKDLSIWKK